MPTMPKQNISEAGGLPPEGWYLARVKECEKKKSKVKGEAYYNVVLEGADTGEFLSYDILMLEGKGNGIGFNKLFALGAAEDLGDEVSYDDVFEIIGKRAWVYLAHDKYDGKTRCKVDISQGRCGYLPESEPPEDEPDIPYGAPPDDGAPEYDDVPF